jgi:hypothetical protein
MYGEQSDEVRLDQAEKRSLKIGSGVRQGCCLSPILFKLYSDCLTKEALEEFGGFRAGGHVIRSVKCADGLELLAKEEISLQGVIRRLIETGRRCGVEVNLKTKLRKWESQDNRPQCRL